MMKKGQERLGALVFGKRRRLRKRVELRMRERRLRNPALVFGKRRGILCGKRRERIGGRIARDVEI